MKHSDLSEVSNNLLLVGEDEVLCDKRRSQAESNNSILAVKRAFPLVLSQGAYRDLCFINLHNKNTYLALIFENFYALRLVIL